jgi:hypothetical protein
MHTACVCWCAVDAAFDCAGVLRTSAHGQCVLVCCDHRCCCCLLLEVLVGLWAAAGAVCPWHSTMLGF